jgi:hypothetical protein
LPDPLVYIPESSRTYPLGLFAYQRACELYTGWALHITRPRQAEYATRLVREFLDVSAFSDGQSYGSEWTREVAAAAFRRGLELVSDCPIPCPAPYDQSPSALRARTAWCRFLGSKLARIESESRAPLTVPSEQ